MALTAADRCCLCKHPITSPQCTHPWAKPFTDWGKTELGQLTRTLRADRHPGS